MLTYPNSYEASKEELNNVLDSLKKKGKHIFVKKHKIDDEHTIDRITIKTKNKAVNTLVFSLGLHGIEGFVGHACLISFLKESLDKLKEDTEVIIYHVLNPYGMSYLERTNDNNVDLNRNFTDQFTNKNTSYEIIKDFLSPKLLTNKFTANGDFYFKLSKLISKHGIDTLNNAILYGQSIDEKGLYYTGTKMEKETTYVIDECLTLLEKDTNVTWIDIHTGFGPKYNMTVYNSRYEKEVTYDMLEKVNYKPLCGVVEDDIYDTQGDMIEYLYTLKNKSKHKKDFYCCCYEFGTIGTGPKQSIDSLKALTFNTYVRFIPPKGKVQGYSKKLMRDLFLPTSEKWRTKAYIDFHQATNEILKYKELVK